MSPALALGGRNQALNYGWQRILILLVIGLAVLASGMLSLERQPAHGIMPATPASHQIRAGNLALAGSHLRTSGDTNGGPPGI